MGNLKLVDIGQFYRTARDIQSSDGACMIRVDPLHWDHFNENGNEIETAYSYACLPDTHDVADGAKCWVAGWGEINNKMNLSNKLRSVALNVVNNEWCIRK